MSLLGLSLAIGILIDDVIVVRENIVRHVEMGKDHLEASREGTDEIGLAVTATTVSILAVFVPIAFLPGVAGQWFKPFGLTIAGAVAVSLSFLDPLAIMFSLPLSMIGVMLALAVTGMSVNIMSLIGVMLLMGIVAKNAILPIDSAKWAREKQGLALREALIEAGAIRLRPLPMTTFALIAGMIPVALGGGEGAQFPAPLGVAVIGGVVTSTLLTLIAIPTFYELLDMLRTRIGRLAGRMAGPETMRQLRAVTGEHQVGP